MKHNEMSPNYKDMLNVITFLSQQILSQHGKSDITELVLHSLCNANCFNLNKAAYFVNNNDFDCLKGVAGYESKEDYVLTPQAWSNRTDFEKHIKCCQFNKQVKAIIEPSVKNQSSEIKDAVGRIACKLSIEKPNYYLWDAKHDNQGLLIFDSSSLPKETENILQGLCLLGFCPIS